MASSHKKLVKMARRWRRRARGDGEADMAPPAAVASKGHIVLYTVDGKRFMVPVSYLSSNIFRELLDKAEELFGLPIGPIRLPCDAQFMQRVVSCLSQGATKGVEKALLRSISTTQSPPSASSDGANYHQHHQLLCSF